MHIWPYQGKAKTEDDGKTIRWDNTWDVKFFTADVRLLSPDQKEPNIKVQVDEKRERVTVWLPADQEWTVQTEHLGH